MKKKRNEIFYHETFSIYQSLILQIKVGPETPCENIAHHTENSFGRKIRTSDCRSSPTAIMNILFLHHKNVKSPLTNKTH